jgi:hypothetical protein
MLLLIAADHTIGSDSNFVVRPGDLGVPAYAAKTHVYYRHSSPAATVLSMVAAGHHVRQHVKSNFSLTHYHLPGKDGILQWVS